MSPRSSQRVDRRRRALVDETRNEETAGPRIFRADPSSLAHRYNKAALDAINAPIAKYIPLRPYHLVIWFLVGLIPIIGLLLLDTQRSQIGQFIGAEAAHCLDLAAPGNLMSWLSSMTFGFATAVMLGTYSVRRHRRDDYRGRFTVWRWAIFCAVLVSIDATVGIHHAWQGICQTVTQTNLWGDGKIWWIGAWTILFGSMLVRLMFEMSSSRQAIGWAIGAAACYLCSAAVELGAAPLAPHTAETTKIAALLLGHHMLLFSLINYAREVVLEAMGLVESPVVRRAKAKSAKEAKAQEKAAAKKAVASKAAKKKAATKEAAEKKSATKKAAAKQEQNATTDDTKKSAAKSKTKTTETSKAKSTRKKAESAKPAPKLRAVVPEDVEAELNEYTDDRSYDADERDPPQLSLLGVDVEEEGSERKLSKAERRRLRKEQKRRNRAA